MLANRPPMGWNSWNTFGPEIDEQVIRETIDAMADGPFRQAGYEYVVIDDCWARWDRNERGLMECDPKKFPSGMKALADYAHAKGLKFGMYSCAGVRTCAGYPGSFDHEYEDARLFASWGVDFLKYDFCNFPAHASNPQRYLTMSMALRASGREILFSACNWGRGEPWRWMRSVGAHMYRSDTDIRDSFRSTADIMRNQLEHLGGNAPGCFNDLDMLTVGIDGRGQGYMNVGEPNSRDEYETQFAFWCLTGAPLMLGCDVRSVSPEAAALLTHRGLLAISQDELCLPPYIVQGRQVNEGSKNDCFILMKLLADGEFALGFFNLNPAERRMECIFADCGIPSGHRVTLTDVMTGESLGDFADDIILAVRPHHCRILRGRT